MDTLLGRYKNLIVLAAILFAQIIALAMQVRRPAAEGETRLIRVWATAAVTPFEEAIVHTQKWAHDKWSGYVYLRHVDQENQQLRAEINRMKLEQARLAEDANMARRVQTLLAFKEQYLESTVAAQVIGTSGSEQSRVLYIDKGSSDGIKLDMAVITPTGIVGKIVQVFPGSSQVLPINDQLSGVGAALKALRLQGILKGAANGTTTLQYIMSDEPVKLGEEVITSGGDRIFPKGLPVGTVASVEPGKDLFLNIRVIPSARLDRLEEVLVVTKIQDKLPDAKDLGPIRASDILSERLPGVPVTQTVDAAGNAAGTASGAGNPTQPNGAPSATAAKPGAATNSGQQNAAGSSGTAKPGAAGSSVPKATATPASNPANGGANSAPKPNLGAGTTPGASAPKPVRKAPATVSPDANPTQPATPPSAQENPPR
ncbi:MAG TPA: rod shape-determining protein MreC [Candidatus Limnocylindrales bacterium]|nr:rod shape-determining protein MreC [Candidatus Limnocylindrales bacterium]